nr:ACT domain-containing protein [Kineosphaera limosa]
MALHTEPVKIARLEPGSPIPTWARSGGPLASVTWNAHETSVVAAADAVPIGVDQAGPFLAFEVQGPLDFTLVGVLRDLLDPLTGVGVSVVTMSTFDTDWFLVPLEQVGAVTDVWRAAGHTIAQTASAGVGTTATHPKKANRSPS